MTSRRPLLAIALAASLAAPALAQHATPYAGQQARDIKSLAPDEVEGLLAGRGSGLAKAAELNGYPGPMHVLELGEQLALSPDQRARTEALHASMGAKARALGRELVEAELELDRLFASKTVTPASLERATKRVGELQARVRAAHLEAHIEQRAILTPAQNERYAELRGYGSGQPHGGQHGGHRRH